MVDFGMLERLLATDFPMALEVLVVDDGSTDEGPSRIRDLVDGSSVRLITHPMNLGKGAAIRTGLEHATGHVFTVLDATSKSILRTMHAYSPP